MNITRFSRLAVMAITVLCDVLPRVGGWSRGWLESVGTGAPPIRTQTSDVGLRRTPQLLNTSTISGSDSHSGVCPGDKSEAQLPCWESVSYVTCTVSAKGYLSFEQTGKGTTSSRAARAAKNNSALAAEGSFKPTEGSSHHLTSLHSHSTAKSHLARGVGVLCHIRVRPWQAQCSREPGRARLPVVPSEP
jgi:hypothetical protein